MPSTLHRKAPWQASASLVELFERFFDLIGQIEQELGLSLDVGQRALELDGGGRARAGLPADCSSSFVGGVDVAHPGRSL